MNTAKQLDKLLSDCCEKLVDCASAITDLPLAHQKENVYKIGKAIAEVSEVRSQLYETHPELKPELWDEPPSENHYREWFAEAQRIAKEYCGEGKPEKALSTFESFLFIGPSRKYQALATEEIEALRKEHGI